MKAWQDGPSATRMEIAELIQRAGEAELDAILRLLRVRAAMPAGFAEVVAVLEAGAAKHNGGDLRVAARWVAEECVEHLLDHARAAHAHGPESADHETGRLDAAHAAARGVMVCQLVRGGK